MTEGKVTRAEAERQVAGVVDRLEAIRQELAGIASSMDEAEEAEGELRRVVECVLADRIEWALRDLRTVVDDTWEEPA